MKGSLAPFVPTIVSGAQRADPDCWWERAEAEASKSSKARHDTHRHKCHGKCHGKGHGVVDENDDDRRAIKPTPIAPPKKPTQKPTTALRFCADTRQRLP
jgi:hypothetical protein